MAAYYKRMTSKNTNVRAEAAKAWSVWKGTISKLITNPKLIKHFACRPTT